jgi:hypothetical protein
MIQSLRYAKRSGVSKTVKTDSKRDFSFGPIVLQKSALRIFANSDSVA